jgi:DNA-3-methyladenine glycosylase I
MLSLEGAQAGLNWEIILNRRVGYRRLFHNFDPVIVAQMVDDELETALKDPAIVRNRRKVFSVRNNAQVLLDIQRQFDSFDAYLWRCVGYTPIVNHWTTFKEIPSRSIESDTLAKDLKRRGMLFVGTTILYALMQAVGMVNDHLVSCPFRFKPHCPT